MTWLSVNPAPHTCTMPLIRPEDYKTFDAGSRWKCDDCYAVWEVTGWVTPVSWDSLHPTWKLIS